MLHNMKSFQKLILSVLLLLNTTLVMAQFGNEWIDYSKTYYKFSTWNNRMYRIPQSTLISAGISATVKGSELKMYKMVWKCQFLLVIIVFYLPTIL